MQDGQAEGQRGNGIGLVERVFGSSASRGSRDRDRRLLTGRARPQGHAQAAARVLCVAARTMMSYIEMVRGAEFRMVGGRQWQQW